jgi:transposase InsO family protein
MVTANVSRCCEQKSVAILAALDESMPCWFLLHDRDSCFATVGRSVHAMGIRDVWTAPRSPWQNGFAERVIGSIRRECLDHLIVFNEGVTIVAMPHGPPVPTEKSVRVVPIEVTARYE